MNVPHLHVTHDGDPIQFSLDGGMIETNELTVDCDPGAMQFLVGPSYDPGFEQTERLPEDHQEPEQGHARSDR